MTTDDQGLGTPPGQSTIRIEEGSDPIAITNVPLTNQNGVSALGPIVAKVGSCSNSAGLVMGWLFLLFGVLFIGSMALATLVFNQPFRVNGNLVNNDVAALYLGGFFLIWVTGCTVWIYLARRAFIRPGKVGGYWRLVLGEEEWVCSHAYLNQTFARCAPIEIERLERSAAGTVVAHLQSGRKVDLTGPLPPQDSNWLSAALSQHLGQSMAEPEATFPYVPERDAHTVAGTTLAWRVNRSDSPWTAAFIALFVAVFWNGIVGVFVGSAFWGDRQINWVLGLFLIPFVLIGIVLIFVVVSSIYHAIVQSRIGSTAVELEALPLIVGTRSQAIVLQHGPLQLRRLSVRLVCDEEAEYRHGTSTSTDTKRVREVQVYEQFDLRIERHEPLAEAFDLRVAADLMHSFKGLHNAIKWKLIVRGEPETWPAYEREFPIVINPPSITEAT